VYPWVWVVLELAALYIIAVILESKRGNSVNLEEGTATPSHSSETAHNS
jgi:hypothetical protein